MKFHSLANLFPLIEGDEFESLVTDIKDNGLQEPIAIYEGKILDGRNRFRACQRAKVKPRFAKYTGKDPLSFVLSLNLRRRQMDESQRSMSARRVMTTKHGGDRKSTDQEPNSSLDLVAVAKLFNVGVNGIKLAGRVLEKGSADVVRAVDRGELAVSKAATWAKKPASEQKKLLTAYYRNEPKPQKPKGNLLIKAWDSSNEQARLLFLEERGKIVRETLDAIRLASGGEFG